MYLQKKYIHRSMQDKQLLKAVALSLFCKYYLNMSNVHKFTYNHLHELTGLHVTTLKKRVGFLLDAGLAVIKNGTLIFKSLKKKNHRNNVSLTTYALNTVKDFERLMQSLMIAYIQQQKELVCKAIDTIHNTAKNNAMLKSARKFCRKHGHLTTVFKDNGISYKHIAKKTGLALATAVRVVKFAVRKHILNVRRGTIQYFCPNVAYSVDKSNSSYTYSTKNNIYIVPANKYSLSSRVDWEERNQFANPQTPYTYKKSLGL